MEQSFDESCKKALLGGKHIFRKIYDGAKMKKHWRSFTLIEMMVSLTIFSIVMVSIYSLLSMSINMINNMAGSDESSTEAILFSKFLEFQARDAYGFEQETNGIFLLRGFTKNYRILVSGNAVLMDLLGKHGIKGRRVFLMKKLKQVELTPLGHGGREGIHLRIRQQSGTIDKYILLGYKKGEKST